MKDSQTSQILAQLRKVLDYDPDTGIFRWRVDNRNVGIGDEAGDIRSNGYRRIGINGCRYQASRLAWLYIHGQWPKGQIDHRNGNRSDNRLVNLRDVSHSGNMQNMQQAHRNSKTGLLGASMHRTKFMAQIHVDGKQRYLGLFATAAEAHVAYLDAKRKLHSTCMI